MRWRAYLTLYITRSFFFQKAIGSASNELSHPSATVELWWVLSSTTSRIWFTFVCFRKRSTSGRLPKWECWRILSSTTSHNWIHFCVLQKAIDIEPSTYVPTYLTWECWSSVVDNMCLDSLLCSIDERFNRSNEISWYWFPRTWAQ